MIKKIAVLGAIFFVFFLSAQNTKSITLEDIWRGKFIPQSTKDFHSMKDGKHYVSLNRSLKTQSTTIDKYSFESQEKVSTIVNSKTIDEIADFDSYKFSKDEEKILLQTDSEQIYRHSKKGKYYLYDIKSHKAVLISKYKIQEPTFSPNGKYIAYVFENNLYIKTIATGQTTQITKDGNKNKIINGITDWVYEEEFGFVCAYQWNSSGERIAFLRFDESKVPKFSMPIYGKHLYPKPYTFKYPKAGENNSKVTLHIYNLSNKTTSKVDISPYYIPRIKWTKFSNILSIQTLNRHQNNLRLLAYDTHRKEISTLINEQYDTYVDITNNLTFLKDGSFLWTSEKDNYNHIYRYSKKGKLLKQITKGNWDVTSVYGYDYSRKRIYYQSTQRGSIFRDVYSIGVNGKEKVNLTARFKGFNDAHFSENMSYYINTYSSKDHPPKYTLYKSNGKKLKDVITNVIYEKTLKEYHLPKKEFSTISINGNMLNMWMIKPLDFNPSKKYPLFMTQYSGPGSQSVSDKWASSNDFWYMMLAQQGYIIACVDGRGTGFKGAQFKKIIYKKLGKYEVEDQISVAKKLSERAYIDANRTGIWGWSYGGFMSANCIFKGSDTFEMAIAVAPVTNWRFYDTIYTERYMQTPQENAMGYDKNSPLNYANKLKGAFLLIHGSADDNVHLENSMRLIETLVQRNKPFDWAIYPDKNHGIYGGKTRLQLYTKMTNFIKQHL